MSNRIAATSLSLFAALSAIATSSALAQAPRGTLTSEFRGSAPSVPFTTPTYAPTPAAPINRHTSTVAEAIGRARAYEIQAWGNYWLAITQAQILREEARARAYQNRVINTETFLTRKQLLDESREAERLRELEKKERALALRNQREQTVLYAAYRLPSSVLNPLTGEINWPEALLRPEMREVTEDLDALFAQLADDGAQFDRMYRDPIIELCDAYRDYLYQNRKQLGIAWQDYQTSRKLLLGMKYTAEYWPSEGEPGVRIVASR